MSKCDIPPAGWRCSRLAGHEGPCAASLIAVRRHFRTGRVSGLSVDDERGAEGRYFQIELFGFQIGFELLRIRP